MLEDKVEEVCEGVEWANEEVIFFVRMDHAQRPYQLFRHKLGRKEGGKDYCVLFSCAMATNSLNSILEDDEMLHEETDERFFLSIGKTHNQQYIEMSLDSQVCELQLWCDSCMLTLIQITSEVHILPVNDATGKFKVFLVTVQFGVGTLDESLTSSLCVQPRQHEVEYSIEIHENTWFLLTNADGCKNFKLLACPTTEDNLQDTSKWTELIPHRRNVKLNYVREMLSFARSAVSDCVHSGVAVQGSYCHFPEARWAF